MSRHNTIGTLFRSEDEKEKRKIDRMNKKPWEQEVRDEKGRKRFHGAFTGGFSAGYFNTVGSKEGWKPSNFSSSRDANRNQREQNVMDFMDQEDINDQIGLHTISSIKDTYKTHGEKLSSDLPINNPLNSGNKVFEKHYAHHSNLLIAQLIPNFGKSEIETMLMKKAGFDNIENQSSQQRNINVAENKYYKGKLDFKDEYYGIGYLPSYDETLELSREKESKEAILTGMKSRIKMDKFEDDSEMGFFNSNDISGYNFEEVDFNENQRSTNRSLKLKESISAPKFIKSLKKLNSTDQISFTIPKLPKDYDPFKSNLENKAINNKPDEMTKKPYQKMDPERRADLLSEKPNLTSFFKSKFTTVDQLHKGVEVDLSVSNPIPPKKTNPPSPVEHLENYFNFRSEIPFKSDLAKVSRFAKYIAEKEGLVIGDTFSSYQVSMTGIEIREERLLFQNLYETEQKLKKAEENLSNEIKRNTKDYCETSSDKKIRREKTKWQPDKLLCKRFKVKNPYENVIDTVAKKGLNDLQNSILKEEKHRAQVIINSGNQLPASMTSIIHGDGSTELSIKQINNEKNSFVILNSNPDINLFSEIFGE